MTLHKFDRPSPELATEPRKAIAPNEFDSRQLKPWQAYLFAIVSTAVALGIRELLQEQLAGSPTLVIFTVPVMLSGYFGGLRAGLKAGLLATALTILSASYFLLPPLYEFRVVTSTDRWQLFFSALAGVVMSVLNGTLHRARHRANVAIKQYERAEVALIEGSALQSAIFNSANFSSIATDAKGVIQIFNVGAERMLGYAANDVVNRITPADISDSPELIARAQALSVEYSTPIAPGFEALVFKASRGIEDIYELTYIREDKSRFPAVVSVTALRDAQGAIIGYLLIGTDNTARKKAEEALLKASALQNAIFNSANFSSIATDAKGVIQIFNVGAERMLGYAASEVMNKITPADISDPDEVIARAETLSAELETSITPGFEALVFKASRGIEDIYELTYIRKDGSRFPAVVSVTALRDADEAIIGYLLIGTDNTARKQAEAERKGADDARRAMEGRYGTLFECAPDGILIVDNTSTYLDANGSICRMLGYTREELIGKDSSDIVAKSELQHVDVALAQISSSVVHQREWQFRRKDASVFEADVIAAIMPDGNHLAMIRDITERKRIEHALLHKNVELEAASRMKSEFLANMSHELRTPLNAIIGFSEVLHDGLVGDLTSQQRGFIGDIFGSGKHLLSLINDILDLSKVEAGKMTLDLEPVQISMLFANSLSIVREKAAARQIQLDIKIVGEQEIISVDVRKVKQIVYNLLSNAVKFTPVGGHVTLSVDRVPRAEVGRMTSSGSARTVTLPENEFEHFLCVNVTDSGIGIAADALDQLFKPFSQIDSGLARRFEGTGLGLAMVKLLTELHGGAIGVQSQVGEGSSFKVWLPIGLCDPELITPETKSPHTLSAVATPIAIAGVPTALVVEGDLKSAELIRFQLEAEGFDVVHAYNGEEALILAVQHSLALITLDISLPKMDGWECLRRIKLVPELQRVPVVIISVAADQKKSIALGAADVLQKPTSRHELCSALAGLGLFPRTTVQTLKVLVVDDDPSAVELFAVRLAGLATTVLRAYGGREAIEIAMVDLPDLIVLDLMMPECNGFDVVQALRQHPDTAAIPVLMVTAKHITDEDRIRLAGCVPALMETADFDGDRFTAEVRRAVAGRLVEV